MKKIISFMCIFGAIGSAESVQMTPQIQRLMEEKQAKIAELEKCDKNRKAFVIAGVSTLGLTAVGIGGNIALAQKNKKLDAELTTQKSVLTQKQGELSALQAKKEQERIDQAKKDCEQKSGFTWDGSACVPQPPQQVQPTIKNVVGTDCGQGDKTGVLEIDVNGTIDCVDGAGAETKCACVVPDVEPNPNPVPNPAPVKPDNTDELNCRKSGGEWRSDKSECFCGINQGTTDKNMMLAKDFKTCLCKTGYVPIDASDLSKGCRFGSDQTAIDNVIYAISTTLQNRWNKMNADFSKMQRMVTNMDAISVADKAEAANLEIIVAGKDVGASRDAARQAYNAAMDAYNKLSDTDKAKVGNHKTSAENFLKDINAITDKINILLEQAANKEAQIKAQSANSAKSPEAEKCDRTGGKWEGAFCRCDRAKGLVGSDSNFTSCKCSNSNEVYSKTEGKCVAKAVVGQANAKKNEDIAQTQLNALIDGTGLCYQDIDKDDKYDDGCSKFNSMQAGDWGVTFPNYEVYGKAVCNDTGGSYAVASNNEQYETGGVKCWCKMTEPAVSRWVFSLSYSSASACADVCALRCGRNVRANSAFRSGVFGSVAQ